MLLRGLQGNSTETPSAAPTAAPSQSPTLKLSPFGVGGENPEMPVWGTSLLIVAICGFVLALFFVALGNKRPKLKLNLSFSFLGNDSRSEAEREAINEASIYQRQLLAAANMVNLQGQKGTQKVDPWATAKSEGRPVSSGGPKQPAPLLYSAQRKKEEAGGEVPKLPHIQGRGGAEPKASSVARVKKRIKDAMERYVSNRSLEEQRVKSMEEQRIKRAAHLYGDQSQGQAQRQSQGQRQSQPHSSGAFQPPVNPSKVHQSSPGNSHYSSQKHLERVNKRIHEEDSEKAADAKLTDYASRKTYPRAPKPQIKVANRNTTPAGASGGVIGNRAVSFSRLKAAMHRRLGGGEEEETAEDEHAVGGVGEGHRPLSTGLLSAVSSSVSQPRTGRAAYEMRGGEEEVEEERSSESEDEGNRQPRGMNFARQSFARLKQKMSNVVKPPRPPPGFTASHAQQQQGTTWQQESEDEEFTRSQQGGGRQSYRRPLVEQDYESSLGEAESYTGRNSNMSASQHYNGAARMKAEVGDSSSVGKPRSDSLTEYQAKFSQAPETLSATGSQGSRPRPYLPRKKSIPPGLLIPGTNQETEPGNGQAPPPRVPRAPSRKELLPEVGQHLSGGHGQGQRWKPPPAPPV